MGGEREKESNLSKGSRANETRVRALFVRIGSERELLARVNRWVTRETSVGGLSRRFERWRRANFRLVTM